MSYRTKRAAQSGGSLFTSLCCLLVPLEALAAVDRPVVLRNEGDLRRRAALGADRVVHLAGGTPVSTAAATLLTLAGITAVLAADGLVCKALLGVEFLLTGGKNEVLTAVSAS
jgi:hypothetical protein